MMLLSRARRGASGKAATKMVVKPNWRTAAERIIRMSTLARKKKKCWGLNNSLHLHGLFPSPESQNTILSRSAFFTHFEIFIHKPMGVHRLQIPVLVPLRKLGLILYILPSTTSFLHLSTRPPVLQQTENIESSSARTVLLSHMREDLMCFFRRKIFSHANELKEEKPCRNYIRPVNCHHLNSRH